jgi:hypothetical protein
MVLYRPDHSVRTKSYPHDTRGPKQDTINTLRNNQKIYAGKITLLPEDKQINFKIVPTTPKEAIPLVKAFAHADLIGHVDNSPLLRAAEIAAIRQTPSLKQTFQSARDVAAEKLRTHHAKIAAAQAAARTGPICAITKSYVNGLIGDLTND